MSTEWYGQRNTLVKGYEFSLREDAKGLWTGSQKFFCHKDDFATVRPLRGSDHPDFDWVKLEALDVTGMKGEWLEITGQYAGRKPGDGSSGGGGDDDLDAEYGIRQTTREEPLGTADYFSGEDGIPEDEIREATELALNPPKNQDGTLKEIDTVAWNAKKKELYDKVSKGFANYLVAGVEYYVRFADDDLPTDLDDVGYIASPDPQGAPDVGPDRNWLLVGYNITERAEVYDIEKVWLLSDPGGWDETIYTKQVAPE